MTICRSDEHGATDLRVSSTDVINNSFADATMSDEICHSNEHDATSLRVGSVCAINNSFVDAVASVRHRNAHYQH
jgi:hypothetical protein